MANSLLITKETGGYFTFLLTKNGVAQTPIQSIRNDLLVYGTQCHFKTGSGANIIKEQSILPTEITINASGTFTFTTVTQLWAKLIEIEFFDWLGIGGAGTGVDRFDDLLDTFTYFGKNGQAVRVNESEQKLETFTVYNHRNFTDLEDAPNTLVPNKMVVVNNAGTALELQDQPTITPPSLTSVGSFHYVDLATITTPLTVLAGVEKKITNDTLSSETNVLNAPYGISSMWDSVNNQLDFTQCAIGDLVTVIPAIEITTSATNQTFQIYIKMGIGSATPTTKQVYNGALAVIGSIIVNPTRDFTIDTLDNKDYPAEIYILSSANATVKSGELDIRVVRKDINIVSSDPTKQDLLVSGTNIKTINSISLLGSGNIVLSGVGDELTANKQNSLAADGSGVKYPTIDAINAGVVKNFIKSNESLALAKRKDDVLYGILDQYTGEEITLSKVTGTPTVDNVIYFQIGAEYFKRDFTFARPEWFGLDGVNDQAAINLAILASNSVIFKENKTYYTSAPIRTTAYKILQGNKSTIQSTSSTNVFEGIDELVTGAYHHNHAEISNFKITTATANVGINLKGFRMSKVVNCDIRITNTDINSIGIWLKHGSANFQCYFNQIIDNSVFLDAAGTGIMIEGTVGVSGSNVNTIRGGIISGYDTYGIRIKDNCVGNTIERVDCESYITPIRGQIGFLVENSTNNYFSAVHCEGYETAIKCDTGCYNNLFSLYSFAAVDDVTIDLGENIFKGIDSAYVYRESIGASNEGMSSGELHRISAYNNTSYRLDAKNPFPEARNFVLRNIDGFFKITRSTAKDGDPLVSGTDLFELSDNLTKTRRIDALLKDGTGIGVKLLGAAIGGDDPLEGYEIGLNYNATNNRQLFLRGGDTKKGFIFNDYIINARNFLTGLAAKLNLSENFGKVAIGWSGTNGLFGVSNHTSGDTTLDLIEAVSAPSQTGDFYTALEVGGSKLFRVKANGGVQTVDLALSTTPTTSASTYDILTRNTSTGVVEKVTLAASKLGTRTTNATTTGSYAVDWNAGDVWDLTLTGATTITDTNLPTGTATKVIEFLITGAFSWTPPLYWVKLPSSQTYDGAKQNHVVITCINGTPGSEKIYYTNELTT